jgi:hypothetical protein
MTRRLSCASPGGEQAPHRYRRLHESWSSVQPRGRPIKLFTVTSNAGSVLVYAHNSHHSDFTSAFGGAADMAEHAAGPVPVEIDPGCVKTLRGIIAPGILGSTVMRRARKRKNLSSVRHYDQMRFRFHTTKTHCRSPADGRMHAIAANFARTIACWGEKLRLFPFRLPRSLQVQRLGGRSSPPACAGYVRKQRFAVRWNIVAAPGNMLIGTD